jgi:MbtH protein
MTSPFENDHAQYRVLINDENQHSLWPDFIEVPAGWRQIQGPASKAECLVFIETNWTDMRPRSLAQSMTSPK